MPINKIKVGCVMPCYKGGKKTIDVIKVALNYVDLIVLIDDKCPFRTGEKVKNIFSTSSKVKVIFNLRNLGVGGATKIGINFLEKQNCDIIVKLDADGQLNPELIPALIKPLVDDEFEAAKGNRFSSLDHLLKMPLIRVIGNLGLSFLNKLSTGYWELFDPTNGFLAFRTTAIRKIRIDKVNNRYFFESDLLFQCSLANICFTQLPMRSIYGNEISSLSPLREVLRFSKNHLINFFKRIIYQYFLLDFNIGSLEILTGFSTGFLLLIFCIRTFLNGFINEDFATPGEANLIAFLSIITTQLFIGFLYFDSTHQPLSRRLKRRIK